MKIEIDGQRYHTLDEASEITGLRQTTLQTYQRAEKGAIPPVSIKIGKELLLSEKFLSELLAKEEKRRSLEVKVGDWTFASQKEASVKLGTKRNYISGWLSVEQAIAKCRKDGLVSEPQTEPVSDDKPKGVQIPKVSSKVAEKLNIKVVGHQPVTPAEQVPIPKAKKPQEKRRVLLLGGQPFWSRWRDYLKTQNIELICYDSRYPKTNVVLAKVRDAEVVVVAQNMMSHRLYSLAKEHCKKSDIPLVLFTGFGNAVIKQAIDKAFDKKKDNK